jgi:hypothetical protein
VLRTSVAKQLQFYADPAPRKKIEPISKKTSPNERFKFVKHLNWKIKNCFKYCFFKSIYVKNKNRSWNRIIIAAQKDAESGSATLVQTESFIRN